MNLLVEGLDTKPNENRSYLLMMEAKNGHATLAETMEVEKQALVECKEHAQYIRAEHSGG